MADVQLLTRTRDPARADVNIPVGNLWTEIRFRPKLGGQVLTLNGDGVNTFEWAFPSDFADPDTADGTGVAPLSSETVDSTVYDETQIDIPGGGNLYRRSMNTVFGPPDVTPYTSIFVRAAIAQTVKVQAG